MADSYDFDDVDLFTVGTLGPKGERVFYLQCMAEGSLVSLRLEKQQVAALAEFLDRVLDDLPDGEPGEPPDDLALHEPVISAWTVGSLGVAYRDEDDKLVVLAEELMPDDDDEDAVPASARFGLRRAQVLALIDRARDLVAAGRPPCPYCARPLEPANGDWCPCSN